MEKEKLENILLGIGIKTLWISKENLLEKLKSILKDKKFYISPYFNLGIENSNNLEEAEIGIFEAICLCKKTGTILVFGNDLSSLVPPQSIAILKEENIKDEIDSLIDIIKTNPEKAYSFITGPSRTADIEKEVVIPAHGPEELLLIICK